MKPTLNLIGAGHVGRVFGRLLAPAFVLQDVLTRSAAGTADAIAFMGAGSAADSIAAMRSADLWLLAVRDDQIGPVCAELAAAHVLNGAVVFHCSGAKTSDELLDARQRGAAVASVHPIRSFADPAQVASQFGGTYCGVEGDERALGLLTPALLAIGAQPVALDAAAKTVYHAASVFASNYLVTLLDAALRAYQAAGIPEAVARALAQPLASESLANVFRLGPEAALSGPIARGDMATVARQQAALDVWDEATGKLYQAMADATLELARRKALA